jgi:RNA polymerase sigma factor (sigma-70 family)
MAEAPTTRPSLLVRLRDAHDQEAWAQFVDLYAPVVYGYARKRGLQDADAADLTQAVLSRVAAHVGRFDYDPRRGGFRAWLFTIVRSRLCDELRGRRNGTGQGSGDTGTQRLLEAQPAPAEDESAAWEREYQRGLFTWAAAQVRPLFQQTTWEAFWQTAVEGKRARQVAEGLGLTVVAVYQARSRVLARLRAEIQQQLEEA